MAFCSLKFSQNVYWAYSGMKRARMFFAGLIQSNSCVNIATSYRERPEAYTLLRQVPSLLLPL